MPGLGQVDWGKFIKALKDPGHDRVISIKHEDLLYEGREEKDKEGLHGSLCRILRFSLQMNLPP